MADRDGAQIAVTVIGGYLGAGKTTLLNHILRTADERLAVLVNDFGDINIDEALIESNDGETLSLANGCICCSLVDGFGVALETILAIDPRPERLVIEASGVADPAAVAAWGHGPGFTLDATVVVADAETIRAKSRDKYVGDTIVVQLRAADIIVLNKVDLIDATSLESTRIWLGETCPEAAVVEATGAAVSALLLFGADRVSHSAEPAHVHADEIFETWDWAQAEAAMARHTIETMMDELPESVVRAKGVLWLEDEPDHQMILQRVGHRWTVHKGRPWPLGEERGESGCVHRHHRQSARLNAERRLRRPRG